MAVSRVDVHIQNPAGKRSTNMTAKQIKYFGSKRQKAALKAKRSKTRHSAKKRHAPAKRTNAAPKKQRKSSTHRHSTAKKRRKTSHRSRTVKRNPELVSFLLGNPAKRSTKKVAHSKKRRKSSASRSNAGSRRRKTSTPKHRHSSRRRLNPAGVSIKDMVYGGGGGLVGFFGSAGLTQMVLGSGNTGMTGYAVTAAVGIGLTILSHMFLPRERSVTFGVAVGAVMNLGRRIITDQTPFGAYLTTPQLQGGAGMGDYMVANWGPPIMTDGLNGAMAAGPGAPAIASSGINMLDYADIRAGGSRPC